MSKACKYCRAVKPLEDFPRHKQMRDGHLNKCRTCANAYHKARYAAQAPELRRELRRDWVARNREKVRDYQTEFQRDRRQQIRAILDDVKSAPCVDCGVCLPPACMDLDHVRGTKSFNIGGGRGGTSIKRLLAEIAKCEVRCPNCHRLRHNSAQTTSD